MTTLEQARRLCRELAGPDIDVWTLPAEVVDRAQSTGRPLAEVARDVVSAWWVRRAQRGDEAARQALLEMWMHDVVRWCRWNAPRGVDPEDAAHDVLVRAARRLASLDRPYGVRPWFWAITWRVLREQGRRPWLRRWIFGARTDDRPCPAPDAHARLEGAQRVARIREVLQQLSLEERTLLWHAYVDRRTRRELAELMGIPEGSVNRMMTRARQHFRAEAERRGLRPSVEALADAGRTEP